MATNFLGKAALGVAKGTGSFLVGQVKDQMVSMIESYEPQLEAGLREQLVNLRKSNPEHAKMFVENWKKLDRAVFESLSAPVSGGKRSAKRTKRHSRK